jgi:hypothetical protein
MDQVEAGRYQADQVSRYYYNVADKAQKWHLWTSLGLTVVALAAGLLLIVDVHRYAAASVFFVVTGLSLFAFYWKHAEHGAVANLTSLQYKHLAREWEELQLNGEASLEKISALRTKHDTIANAVDLPNDTTAWNESRRDAERFMKAARPTPLS